MLFMSCINSYKCSYFSESPYVPKISQLRCEKSYAKLCDLGLTATRSMCAKCHDAKENQITFSDPLQRGILYINQKVFNLHFSMGGTHCIDSRLCDKIRLKRQSAIVAEPQRHWIPIRIYDEVMCPTRLSPNDFSKSTPSPFILLCYLSISYVGTVNPDAATLLLLFCRQICIDNFGQITHICVSKQKAKDVFES